MQNTSTVATKPMAFDRSRWLVPGLFLVSSALAFASAATSWVELRTPRAVFSADHRFWAAAVGIVLLILAAKASSERVPRWGSALGAVVCLALGALAIYDLVTGHNKTFDDFVRYIIGERHIRLSAPEVPGGIARSALATGQAWFTTGAGAPLAIAAAGIGLIASVLALYRRSGVPAAAAVLMIALTACTTQPPLGGSPSIPPPDDPSTVPTWLTITCDKSGDESISGQYVQAQADGVHLKLVDEHGKPSWVVETGGPGQYSQSCSRPNWCDFPDEATAPAAGAGCVWYRVVDPHGYYINGPTWRDSRHQGCAVIDPVNVTGRVTLRQGQTLEWVIRQQLAGLAPTDKVLLVGYVRRDPRMFILTRRGGFLAEVGFQQVGANQWEWEELLTCNDDRLTWSPA